jgi:hypothetical protein
MKTEITPEQIKQSEYYQQAEKIAECVVIPELSEDSQLYLDAVKDYETITRNLNSISSTRFSSLNMYSFTPDIEEFNKNLESLRDIEIEIRTARTLHDGIVSAIEDGLHETAIKEQADRLELIRAKQMITSNAYTAQKTRLEEMAKTTEQLAKKRAKELAKKGLI